MNSRQVEALDAVLRHIEAEGIDVASHQLGELVKMG